MTEDHGSKVRLSVRERHANGPFDTASYRGAMRLLRIPVAGPMFQMRSTRWAVRAAGNRSYPFGLISS